MFGLFDDNDDALESQEDWNHHLLNYLQWRTKIGREDIAKWMPKARESGKAGYRAALNAQRHTIPEQLKALRHANTASQEALLAGLPQMNNAVLGQNVNLGGLQSYDPGNRAEAHFKEMQTPYFMLSQGQKENR